MTVRIRFHPPHLWPLAAARAWLLAGAALWGAFAAPAALAQDANRLVPFSNAQGAQPPAPWRFTTLPHKAPTRFDVTTQPDGQHVLRVEADQSYGNLVHPTQVVLGPGTSLAWRWRVDEFVQGADLRTRAGDDGAAKLCVFFDLAVERLSFGERARLALARSSTGEDIPSEVLCYVWDNREAKDTLLVNAFTQRMRMLVLESGATPGGWLSERRSVLADYRRAFGTEAGDTLPDVVAVAVSADADNTHGHGLAYFSDIDLRGPWAVHPPVVGPAGAAPGTAP
ncbi:DUF3047 domain-containing protein [Variovorax ginsengisoli]|uniref:DUF3047 domain-containing protein n=1 Tax=Variovorax ginsengisoli TaxID=363844 RepID=A0ABT9S1Z0_9BURK|nr:DUF3047 domain-containing protein [Variovorax ginsengisoli]MDP9898235.1 hypothetical protein [Variovorax ginsengisoli]